ncbi:MAG: cupin domain-containing protein [Thermoleophilaceae bacterium]
MSDVTVKRLEEFEEMGYKGLHMYFARRGLGVTSFGISVITIEPNNENYPEHDHSPAGKGGEMFGDRPDQLEQEEVYTVLEGAATLSAGGEEWRLEPGVFARIAAGQARKFVTGAEGVKLLALGATPGEPFDTGPEG